MIDYEGPFSVIVLPVGQGDVVSLNSDRLEMLQNSRAFKIVSNMLELLQTILKTSRLCIPTCWINCKILYHLTIVLSCSKNCFQHVGVQLVIDEVMKNYISFIYCAFYLFPTCWNYCKLFLNHLHYVQH